MKRLSILSLFFLFACGGNSGPIPGRPSNIASQRQATVAECPNGGVVIDYGIDDDGDGQLDPNEVDGSEVVCHGADGNDGASALIESAPEPPGANCPDGGTVLTTGVDADGDGVLSPGEVVNTVYTCHGTDGSTVAEGLSSLIDLVPEPAGPNCSTGGTVVRSGVDDNGDGLLAEAEIDQTVFICNGSEGAATLVRTDAVVTGTVCSHGGIAIHSGADLDRDGLLDDNEITATEYLCDSPDGTDALVRTATVATGTVCLHGGVVIHTGSDVDGDGVLDGDEINSSEYLCNTSPSTSGAAPLVRLDSVPTGTICSGGGVGVHSGLDLDGDGYLDNSEITDTDYVCNGAPGQMALLRLDPVPAGPYCANGGVAVHTGLDQDGNGNLDNAEITETEYICNGSSSTVPPQDFLGSFVIRNSQDVSTIMPYTRISGDLTIEGSVLSTVNLPNLTSIGGDLIVNSTQLTNLTMNALASVYGRIEIKFNARLTSFAFAVLSSVEELVIWENGLLTQIILPSVTSIPTSCYILNNDQLTLVRMNSVTSVHDLLFESNDVLQVIDVPTLSSAGDEIRITGHPALMDLAGFSGLTSVNMLSIRSNGLSSLGGLENLATANYLWIRSNAGLATLSALSSLTQVGSLLIRDNDNLTSLHGLEGVTGPISSGVTIRNNNRLADISALAGVTSIDGGLEIEDNPMLASLVGLNSVTRAGGGLLIENNDSLTDLVGLENVTEVPGGALTIAENDGLVSIGLDALTSVGRLGLSIGGNNSLAVLGLPNLATVSGPFGIGGNPVLPTCQAQNLRARVVVGGSTYIGGNDDTGTCP